MLFCAAASTLAKVTLKAIAKLKLTHFTRDSSFLDFAGATASALIDKLPGMAATLRVADGACRVLHGSRQDSARRGQAKLAGERRPHPFTWMYTKSLTATMVCTAMYTEPTVD